MKRIPLLLPIIVYLMGSCTSTKEDVLMGIGQMIIDSEQESMQSDDSMRRAYCQGEITPYYVLITEKEKHDRCELYVAYISEIGEVVDAAREYKGRTIAIRYDKGEKKIRIPSDSCDLLSNDEREWFILYNTKNNQYVAVKSILNAPPETILQLNQREWREVIMEAIIDTSVPFPSAPPLPDTFAPHSIKQTEWFE